MRFLFLILGLFFCGLGFIGVFLPVLPTVPFLLLAAACFSRSSERLENWLLSDPRFGPLLSDWRARRAIPRRGKYAALIGCSIGYAGFQWGSHPGWIPSLLVGALMAGGVLYVFSRPDS